MPYRCRKAQRHECSISRVPDDPPVGVSAVNSTTEIPDVGPDATSLEAALAYAAAGLYVLPTRAGGDAKHAGSRLGAGWPSKSSRDPEVIASWFAGTDDRVAIHCGRSGLIVADVDHPESLPDVLDKALHDEAPPYQSTRPDEPGRGHYLFAQPPGRRIGNRSGDMPKGWGEWRGANGIILVGGPGRSWPRVGPVPVLPAYVADLLPDVGDALAAVSDADVAQFVRHHTLATNPNALGPVLTGFERQVAEGVSRHDSLVSSACWAAREAIQGKYPAKQAFRRLTDLFAEATAEPRGTERVLTRPQAEAEALSAVAWAVAQEWTAPGVTEPIRATDADGQEIDPAAAAREAVIRQRVDEEIQRLDIRERAESQRRARDRRPLARMSATEFLAAPQPTYLVPGLLYVDSLAVVFGPPGAAKTFFTLDLALALSTGRLWRGDTLVPRTRVHYLMAEGQAVNVGRTHAWLLHHGVDPGALDGWFDAFPEPVALTPEGITDYLAAVREDRPGLIVLDTKHAMMEGDESKAMDIKVMRDALSEIRRVSGACVLLVDHTGLGDQDRARGSNSQKAMVATEIKLSVDGDVRTAEITRNTAGAVSGAWSFTLEPVPGAPHPDGTDTPVVPLPTDGRRRVSEPLRSSCWSIPREDLPLKIGLIGGATGEAACDIFRAMHEAASEDGLTMAKVRELVAESPREHAKTTFHRAIRKLSDLQVIEHPGTTQSWILAREYEAWTGSDDQ